MPGPGRLDVLSGGSATNTTFTAGRFAGSTATLNVGGTNSSWVSSSTAEIGRAGGGNLTVSAGGLFQANVSPSSANPPEEAAPP